MYKVIGHRSCNTERCKIYQKYLNKTEKKIVILFRGIYRVNSISELNIKTIHAEMIHFHWYEPRTQVKNK